MADQVPSVGRVVHYVAYGTSGGEFPAGAHRAAIITDAGMATPGCAVAICVRIVTGGVVS